LQSDYGQAVMWSKGYAAEETEAAFARATELAAQAESASERFAAYIGQLASHLWRGEFRQAEEVGEKFVHEAEMVKRRSAAAAARNLLGLICLFQGKFSESQSNLERGMADWNAARDRAQPFRNRPDYDVFATSYLGLVAWVMGDPGRAQSLTEQAIQRAINLGHVQTTVQAYLCRTLLEIYRDDPTAALRSAELLLGLARQHEMQLYAALGELYLTWARSQLQVPQAGVAEFRRVVADYTKMGNKAMLPNLLALLAKCEADAQNFDAAGTTIDEALFRASESGERWTDAFVHRIRGDILLKRDRTNPAPAEEAFQTAIAVAKKQGARSYELLACLSLAKLYQSTSRPTEAHAVLAPALEGFAPTPEMPEIAEAHALLERLTLAGEAAIVAKGRATEG
jgi:predicted ATPase